MTRKWNALIQIALVLAAIAGSVYVAQTPANSLMCWYNIDDAFYYYKVAQNVLAGHSFTFDGINLSNGFHPLWMVVCLGVFWLSRFNLILPLRVLVLVSGLFNAATALVLYALLRKHIHPMASVIGAFGWALLPTIYNMTTVHGMESSISVFFIVLLIKIATNLFMGEDKKPITFSTMAKVGFIGALTILARLDNVFVVGTVGLFLLFKITKISKLYIFDLIALSASVVVSWVFRLGVSNAVVNLSPIYLMLALALFLKPIVYYFCGLYTGVNRLNKFSKIAREIVAAGINALVMFGLLIVLYRFGFTKMFSRSIVIYDALLSFILILCLRLVYWKDADIICPNPFAEVFAWIKLNWKEKLVNGSGYAVPIATLVGAYMVINKVVFGTFTPVSGQIKSWWSTLPNTVYSHANSLISVLGLSNASNYGPWSIITAPIKTAADFLVSLTGDLNSRLESLVFLILFIVLLIVLVAILSANDKKIEKKGYALFIPAILVGCLLQITYYAAIGYQHTRSWYWLPEIIVVTLVACLLFDGLFTWLDLKSKRVNWSFIIAGILVLGLAAEHAVFIVRLAPAQVTVQEEDDYISEVREVESLTPEGSIIGMTGGGMVAYFIQDRTIVNLDGLINSAEYFHALKNNVARDFLDALPLNFVYGQEYVITESDPYKEILGARLIKIGVVKGFENFTLYSYVINQ